MEIKDLLTIIPISYIYIFADITYSAETVNCNFIMKRIFKTRSKPYGSRKVCLGKKNQEPVVNSIRIRGKKHYKIRGLAVRSDD